MRRRFLYNGKIYEAGGVKSEWVLRFWDDGGVDIGSVRNHAGANIYELSEAELCLHLARASREQVPDLLSER